MAGSPSVAQFAAKALKLGLSGREGLKAYRADGGSVRDATWFRAVGEVRRRLSNSLEEATRPLNRRPRGDEIIPIRSPKGSGYIQQVSVLVEDKETGDVATRPFFVRGRGLLTRQATIDAAIEAFETGVTGSPDRYNERILGAVYENTLELKREA